MRILVRACFGLSLTMGRLLRSARYSSARTVLQDGGPRIRKRRLFYAPLLIWVGGPLARILDTGVRVLPQRSWEERERRLYARLYGASLQAGAHRALVLPFLPGRTLAALLEDPALPPSLRTKAIERAAAGLAAFHHLGFTHGDAMAENVLVDLAAGTARWFDFETIHDADRSPAWRRADDVRALLATCLVRTSRECRAEALRIVLDAYADDAVTPLVAASFTPVCRRPLAFHLAQAALSFESFQEIGRLLRERVRQSGVNAGPTLE